MGEDQLDSSFPNGGESARFNECQSRIGIKMAAAESVSPAEFRQRSTIRNSPQLQRSQDSVPACIVQICMDLSYDLVYHVTRIKKRKPSSKHASTMRRTVQEMSEKHEIVFNGIMNKLQLTPDTANVVFINVANEIFKDGQINWGRVVSVYAFGARIAKHFVDSSFEKGILRKVEKVADFVGKYVAEKLGHWINEQGGWDNFDEHFQEQPNFENVVWKGLFVTALSLGALATMVVVR